MNKKISTPLSSIHFVSIYYALLSFMIYRQAYFFISREFKNPNYVFFAKILYLFPESHLTYMLLFLTTLCLCLYCMARPYIVARIALCLLFLTLMFAKFSFGKIDHSHHPWMISSILMCFINIDKPLISYKNLLPIRLIQASLLCHYFIAGLWKLRSLNNQWQFDSFIDRANEYVAYTLMEGIGPNSFVLEYFVHKYPTLLGIGLIGIILFQITSIAPLFFNNLFFIYGLLALGFHFSTGVFLGLWFNPTFPAILFFLVWIEMYLKEFFKK